MTPERLAEIRARIAQVPFNTGIGCKTDGITYYAHGRSDEEDRALIDSLMYLKQDVPDLLAALEAATAEAAMYRGALTWVRDGLDQMYSVTNEHGLRRLPPELENHAGIIGGLHRTAIIALGENPDGGPR